MDVIDIDAGSTTTKGVLMRDGNIVAHKLFLTAGNPQKAMETLLIAFDYHPNMSVVTTGYGRKLIPFSKSLTEISCHAKGAKYLYPETANIIDIGGQDSKVIRLDSYGNVDEFNMNDKCAAGTGRFVEVLMRIMDENIEELDQFVEQAKSIKITSMCTVFAETEVISLISKGEAKDDIALGVLDSICERIVSQLLRLPPSTNGAVFFSGGLAFSEKIRCLLMEKIKLDVVTHPLSQYTGAIGAALMGKNK